MKIKDFLFSFFRKRGFEGASKGRRTKNWNASNRSADSLISGSLELLRSRSRDLVRNNPYACNGINFLANNIVGEGIMATITHPDPKAQKLLRDEWDKWANSKQCDYDGQNDFAGMQRVVAKAMVESGEVLVRSFTKSTGFPLELQILEADFLPVQENKVFGGNQVYQGIEYNTKGKRVAYHLYTKHPGSNLTFVGYDLIRVVADEIAHCFRVDRPGQNRGIPAISSVIIRLRDLDEYEDAQLVRQKIAACFVAFVHDIDGIDANPNPTELALLEKMEPGIIERMPPGKQVTFGNPPTVQNYREYISVNLHAVASGLQISYEALTNDLSEVNFSSGRMGAIETSRTINSWRKVLKSGFLDFAAKKFLQRAFLMGLNTTGAKFSWTYPKREMIDPTKEVPAQILAIRGGIDTLPEALRKNGRVFEEALAEIDESNKMIDKLGLVLDCDPRKVTQQGLINQLSNQQGANNDQTN